MDTQAARTELEQIIRDVDSSTAVLVGEDVDASSELSHVTQHPADIATEVSDSDREHAVLDAAQERKTEAEAALARLDDGTYGTCIVCGKPIEEARLEFRPEAARCLADQEAFESSHA